MRETKIEGKKVEKIKFADVRYNKMKGKNRFENFRIEISETCFPRYSSLDN